MIEGLKAYPKYKDSGVAWFGEIPEHWEHHSLCALSRIRAERNPGNLGLLSVFLHKGVIPYAEGGGQVHAPSMDLSKYQVVHVGDFVLNNQQAWRGSVGVSRFDGIISPAYVVLETSERVAPAFANYLFRSPALVNQFVVASRGVGDIQRQLHMPSLRIVRTLLPPYNEQFAIARFLSYADHRIQRYIRAKKKLIELLNEQKQAIIHRAVTRGLDPDVRLKPSGVEWLGNVPEHWGIWQIGHFANVGNGSTPSRGNTNYWAGGTYPWLNSSCVNDTLISSANQFVTDLALKECHLPRVQPGSVLVAITGQGKTRGTAAILTIEAAINQHIAFITPRIMVTTTEYLHLALIGAYRELRTISEDAGSTKGALTCYDLRHFKIALPSHSEQTLIIDRVHKETKCIEGAITGAKLEITLLQEYRTRLIADVVTGKLDVREAAATLPDEPDDDPSLDDIMTGNEEDLEPADAMEEAEP